MLINDRRHQAFQNRLPQKSMAGIPPQLPDNEVRKKIQNYSFLLCDRIGKGYSSTVYKGMNDNTKETVAIKVIELKSLRDHVTRGLLDTEIHCLKQLAQQNSPYVLKYFDSYVTLNNCYIVTQYCDGGDLARQIKNKKIYSEKQVMNLFCQLYQGCKTVYQTGFIHRDLKPANIFIKNGTLKIADFGFVKRTSQNPKESYNVGTPIYMSPEAMFHNIYSEKSDVWAMGVICYELIHGKIPWKGLNEKEIRCEIHRGNINFDDRVLSAGMKDFIQRCMCPILPNRIKMNQISTHPWVAQAFSMQQPDGNKEIQTQILSPMDFLPNFQLKTKCSDRTTIASLERNRDPSVEKRTQSSSTKIRVDSVPRLQNPCNSKENNPHNINETRKVNQQQERQRVKTVHCHQHHQSAESIVPITKNSKFILEHLISILNYVRYLYRVYGALKQFSTSIPKEDAYACNQALDKMAKELVFWMQKHSTMVENKKNVFEVDCSEKDWEKFVKNSKFKVYSGVINQYTARYADMKQQLQPSQSFDMPLSILMKQCIANLFRQIENENSFEGSQFQKIELINSLGELYRMHRIMSEQGSKSFVLKSNINKIVETKCVVNEWSHQRLYREIKTKLEILSIL